MTIDPASFRFVRPNLFSSDISSLLEDSLSVHEICGHLWQTYFWGSTVVSVTPVETHGPFGKIRIFPGKN
jgi:hypothetical protein